MDQIKGSLPSAALCSRVYHKDQFVPQEVLDGARTASLLACGCSCWWHAGHDPLDTLGIPPLPLCPASLAGAALHSEQQALLDFLVLARSQRFVGFAASSFSFYLREHRALQVGGWAGLGRAGPGWA